MQASFIAHFLNVVTEMGAGTIAWFFEWKWKSESVRLLVLDNWNLLHCPHHEDISKGWNLRMVTSVFSTQIKIGINFGPKQILKGKTTVLNKI